MKTENLILLFMLKNVLLDVRHKLVDGYKVNSSSSTRSYAVLGRERNEMEMRVLI